MNAFGLLLLLALPPQADLRAAYNVDIYRFDVEVDPSRSAIRGTLTVQAEVTAPALDTLVLDFRKGRKVLGARLVQAPVQGRSSLAGPELTFTHAEDLVRIPLGRSLKNSDKLRAAVRFEDTAADGVGGINFNKTPDGKPWITTSCQVQGGHSWWPQKGENDHPEDKFVHLFMNVTVPNGLTAVCNGRLENKTVAEGRTTFQWRHDYPCENYAVALNVAPYVELSGTLTLPGIPKPVPYSYYVLPQDVEKAKLQFTDVQKMLEVYGEAFGPYPFPDSKFCLVQTPFWGMEHSTVVAYGNSFPKWARQHGEKDAWWARNVFFDYILIHEVAHEWWGNAVSAKDWGHLWLHEGFGTYAEGVYVEKTVDRAAADVYFSTLRWRIDPSFREFRGAGVTPAQAFSNNVYYKGAWILNTLRTYVNDDERWWRALREFNMRFRYKNAVTEDFQKVLEEVTSKSWSQFFQEWFYGAGHPLLEGRVYAQGSKIMIEVDNSTRDARRFHVPLDLQWRESGQVRTQRLMLQPGPNKLEIPCGAAPAGLSLQNTQRILADNRIIVAP